MVVTFGEEGLAFRRGPVETSSVRGMNVLFPALGVFVLRKLIELCEHLASVCFTLCMLFKDQKEITRRVIYSIQ